MKLAIIMKNSRESTRAFKFQEKMPVFFKSLLLTNVACLDCGHEFLELPVEHSLVFYLMEKGMQFDYQDFGVDYSPRFKDFPEVDYLRSNALEKDLRDLVASNYLLVKRSGVAKYYLGIPAVSRKNDFVRSLVSTGFVNYEKLKEMIRKCLKNKREFVRNCYWSYINSL